MIARQRSWADSTGLKTIARRMSATFAVGLFELFGIAIPGGVLLTVLARSPLSALADKVMPCRRQTPDDARRIFLAAVPHARNRPFVSADPNVLPAAAELHNKPVAGEVTRWKRWR